MGNILNKENGVADELLISRVNDPKNIYWDDYGNLRLGMTKRDRTDELLQLLMRDKTEDVDLWVIIPSRWLRQWLIFAHLKRGDPPGKIDTRILLTKDKKTPSGWRPKLSLKPPSLAQDKFDESSPGHFRRITLEAWTILVEMYDVEEGAPAIAVIGEPEEDFLKYQSRLGIFSDVRFIEVDRLEKPSLIESVEDKINEGVTDKKLGGFGKIGGLFGGKK